MSQLVLYMAMSLDGFITGPGDDEKNPAGVGGMRLMEWLGDGGFLGRRQPAEPRPESIFVPTHTAPADRRHERVHFVTEGIVACVEQAKVAAGDRDVMLHGAFTAQECLKAGVLDALEIQLMPVLLGQGRLLFDNLDREHIELDLVRTLESPGVLHLRYEVRRA
jgi:dihydrofolate reductase